MDVLFGSMQRIGLRATWLVAGLLAAAIPALWMWGFTVDDALISVRYARHVVAGVGWRFDAGGPVTDGVTPLPWPLLLAPLAGASALTVLARAKVLGLLMWAASGAALGGAMGRVARAPTWVRAGTLGVLALSVPLAAHAVSGMETAVATTLATLAVLVARRPAVTAMLAGLAASLRPEMAPWACVLAFGLALAHGRRESSIGFALLALVPFVACALVRVLVWGHPAPLSLTAKPGELELGLPYAAAASVVVLTPILVVAPLAVRRSPVALAIVAAGLAHLAAVVIVGGDWMPYARLLVPIAPSLALAAVLASEHAHALASGIRLLVAAALGVFLVVRGGTRGREVGAERAALIALATPQLRDCARVASLDVGWVSAATEADVLDLAGTTDPRVAALPGGHLTKHVDATFLLDLQPDALLLYSRVGLSEGGLADWSSAPYERALERRLAGDEIVQHHFAPTAWLPLGAKGAGYVLLKSVQPKD